MTKLGGRLALVLAAGLGIACVADAMAKPTPPPQPPSRAAIPPTTADHSRFDILKKPFATGTDVTKACLSCHNDANRQLHATTHWTWSFFNEKTGQSLGKKNVVNNLLMSVPTNQAYCTRCHISFGWVDDAFDFSNAEEIDCLACHETTGTYSFKKMHLRRAQCTTCHVTYDKTRVREAVERPDFSKLALSVGKTSRASCGSCHFNSDGGDGVKHGDLDMSLIDPPRGVDIHMSKDGLKFACGTCHETDRHQVPGSRYAPVSKDVRGMDVVGGSRATCESCHGLRPHPAGANAKLNDHVDRVACQTCHIPAFARGGRPTKTYWDWSTAGRKDDRGKEMIEKDAQGRIVYSTKEGSAQWAENIVPDYVWFNGRTEYKTLAATVDPAGTTRLNVLDGSADDPQARIWPVKTMRGKQPYDAGNKVLASVHLFGGDKDAYWNSFDWNRAISVAMAATGQAFSGEVGFIETEMLIPINHMVAPADDAVACDSCHANNSRLAGVAEIYIPGRDANPLLDIAGILMVLAALVGVLGHGVLRLLIGSRNGSKR
ncbi:MAG: tetrathionate reductase family octaheme c-type cytochrome [Hyphomicrobiales bacterium]|nr:tetrathionate reductase family octaheme c-type cytochrome [Hyphomicrobiales bacterium]